MSQIWETINPKAVISLYCLAFQPPGVNARGLNTVRKEALGRRSCSRYSSPCKMENSGIPPYPLFPVIDQDTPPETEIRHKPGSLNVAACHDHLDLPGISEGLYKLLSR
jgi:hypothetical protein